MLCAGVRNDADGEREPLRQAGPTKCADGASTVTGGDGRTPEHLEGVAGSGARGSAESGRRPARRQWGRRDGGMSDPDRPAYHFLPAPCWINDPKPFFHDGTYHVFSSTPRTHRAPE